MLSPPQTKQQSGAGGGAWSKRQAQPASRPGSHTFTSPLKYYVGPEPYPIQTGSICTVARSSSHLNPTFCPQLQLQRGLGSWVCCSLSSQAVPRCCKSPWFMQSQGWCCQGALCCRMSLLPREPGWGTAQPQGPLLPPSPCRLQDKPLCLRGLPATRSHPKTGDDCCSRGQTGRHVHVPALWLESSAAPDPTCNLWQLISSSSCLELLNRENNILFLQPRTGCTSDHTRARWVRSSGQGL